MLRLLLIHGREDPNENMNGWGFNGPEITGIEALHVTYQSTFVLHFVDRAWAARAHMTTGWPYFDDDALQLTFHDDMLLAHPIGCDGAMLYYGDYELQVSPPSA